SRLELWITTTDHIGRILHHFDIGCYTNGLDSPVAVNIDESATWSYHRSTVEIRWCVPSADESAPGCCAHERTNISSAEHIRHQIATRTRHLIDDHDLGSPNTSNR